jgi:hypothetical protein
LNGVRGPEKAENKQVRGAWISFHQLAEDAPEIIELRRLIAALELVS